VRGIVARSFSVSCCRLDIKIRRRLHKVSERTEQDNVADVAISESDKQVNVLTPLLECLDFSIRQKELKIYFFSIERASARVCLGKDIKMVKRDGARFCLAEDE
jgi:hypothetical protein